MRLIKRLLGAVRGTWGNVPGSPGRQATQAAAETVALVIDDTSPIPDTQQDIADLVMRLRGHIMQLTALLTPRRRRGVPESAQQLVDQAHKMRQQDCPSDYMGSRVYLVRLAEVTQHLLACFAPAAGSPDGEPASLASSGGSHAQH